MRLPPDLPPAFADKDQRGSVLAFLGRPKMGKTHRARIIAARLAQLRGPRAVVLIQDPHDQYPGTKWRSLEQFAKADEWPRVNVFPSEHPCAVVAFAVERIEKHRPKIVVVDELDRLCAPGGKLVDQIGRDKAQGEWEVKSPTFVTLTEHRHLCIDLIGGVRRPTDLAPPVRSNITALWVFRLMSPDDAEWVRKTTGSADVAARALDLRPREFVVFDPSDISDIRSDGKIKK